MFDFILKPIGAFLGWLDSWTGSYMVALLIFAVVVEILLLPLGIKQQKTSIKQAKLRPKEMAIQKKYAGRNDRVTVQKMQQELMELRQSEGVGQFGGCLTLLIQLPIILALYQIVINPLYYVVNLSNNAISIIAKFLEYDSARGTIGMISKIRELGEVGFEGLKTFVAEGITAEQSLAAHGELLSVFDKLPDFRVFGGALDLGATPSFTSFNWLLVVPVLTFVVYFLSMKITRKLTYQPTMGGDADAKAMGCSNGVMDIMMPIFSVYITFVVPAAVGIYWIFKSALSSVKQFVLYKTMPLPTFTEEDYKAAEKEFNAKNKRNSAHSDRDPNAARPRSLHHIDDDDYEDNAVESKTEKAPEIAASETPVMVAPLKNDEPDRRAKKNKKSNIEEKENEVVDSSKATEEVNAVENAEATEEAETTEKVEEKTSDEKNN